MKTYIFTILQVNEDNENSRHIMFSDLEFIRKYNLPLSIDIYNNVYEGEITTESENTTDILDDIYRKFNIARPEDFKGHSLSTSDVIKMDGKHYFCDSFGWEEITL